VEDVTALVVTLKVAVVLPATTVTEVGTVAEAVLLDNATDTPPEGAAPLKVTVPVDDVPPVTLVGLSETEESDTGTGVIVSEAVGLAPP
jgi:hypothetical protein